MKLKTIVSATLLATSSLAANATIVDLFNDPVTPAQSVSVYADGGSAANQHAATTSPSTILTDYRDITVSVISGGAYYNDPNDNAGAKALVGRQGLSGPGRYSFSADDSILATGRIQWDGGTDSANPEVLTFDNIKVDLINQTGCPTPGCNAFSSIVLFADQGFEYQIGVYTSATQYSILTSGSLSQVSNVAAPPYTAPYTSNYMFKWFQAVADGGLGAGYQFEDGLPFHMEFGSGGAADLTKVDALEFVINSNSGLYTNVPPYFAQNIALDLSIDSITKNKIPEPSALSLLGLALLGLGFMRRKAA